MDYLGKYIKYDIEIAVLLKPFQRTENVSNSTPGKERFPKMNGSKMCQLFIVAIFETLNQEP